MELVACDQCGFAANQPTRLRCAVCREPFGGSLPKPERRRHQTGTHTRAWRRDLLTRRGARPFVIPFGKVTRIGRGTECEVRVSSPRVSRIHAELRWEKQDLFVRDLGSHNGTRVNDARVDTYRLRDGDAITIGPYRCVYRRLKGGEEETLGRVDTELQALLSHEGAFEADLAERDLLELLQALEVHERTGTLSVTETDFADGVLVVRGGRLVHAASGNLSGDNALRSLLRSERGQLRFVREVADELPNNVGGDSLQDLLLESAKVEDGMLTSKFMVADLLDLDEDGPSPLVEEPDPNEETSPDLDLGYSG